MGIKLIMFDVSSLDNNASVYGKKTSINSLSTAKSDFYDSFGSAMGDSIFSNDFSSTPSLALGNLDSYFCNMDIYSMFLNNNMPMYMQNYYFTNFYNTKTDLKSLKDVYDPSLGNKLANIAAKNASRTNTVGWCAKGTNDSLELAGFTNGETRVASAYQEADKLANHKNFKEVYVSRDDLSKLPAGCIVVWDRNSTGNRPGDLHGHITVTLGNGQEASDHVQSMYLKGARYRVFVPVSQNRVA